MNAVSNFFTQPVNDFPTWFFFVLLGTLCYFIWKSQTLEEKYNQLQYNVRRTIKRETTQVYKPEELELILAKYDGIWEGLNK